MTVPVRCSVNRMPVDVVVPADEMAADFIRDTLRFTGTKLSCEAQVCGACTVLVDGRPASSCTMLAADLDGKQIDTIEGVREGRELDSIQRAFARHQAFQCGFCTPGFIMMATALLAENPDPTDTEIAEWMDGNLCRCTGYEPIITAVKCAAIGGCDECDQAEDFTPDSGMRKDSWDKVTGGAVYATDATLAGMVHGSIVRSTRGHARIRAVDRVAASNVPGVIAVITAEDLDGIDVRFGHIIRDHPLLALEKVRYFGEPIALVVAETLRAAETAAELVEVDYDDLDVLTTPAQALGSSELIHESEYSGERFLETAARSSGNVAHEDRLERGDVDRALAEAHRVVSTTTRFPMLYGYAMEPYNAVASWQPGSLHVISTAQHPYQVRAELARMFSLPLSGVRVEVPYIGGGYGTKSYTKLEPLASAASWLVGRPVKVVADVEGAIATSRADAATVTVSTGFDADGRIVGRDFLIELDTGAYADNSPLVLTKSVNRCFGPYRIPHLRVIGRAVYTNTTPASSYRGFGAPQGSLAGELNMDIASEMLGISPAELRLLNLVLPGDEIIAGKRPLDADLPADVRLVVEALEAHALPEVEGPFRRSTGLAVTASDAGAAAVSTALVRLHSDGSATLNTGSTEMGQGSKTALASIVARTLGISEQRVAVGQSDTRFTPFEWSTGASRTTTVAGLAIQRACESICKQLAEIAASVWECDPTDCIVSGTDVAGPGDRSSTAADLIAIWFGANAGEITGIGVVRPDDIGTPMPAFWEIGVVGVEVCVDTRNGRVTIDHLVTVGDVGHAIQPELVEGQDLGAATQGLGAALFEELVYDGAQLLNSNMIEYRIPRVGDRPRRITSILAERADGIGPFGAKGSGEGAMNPIPAAVAAAVGRAIGHWPTELPLTPSRVWELIHRQEMSDHAE